MIFIYVFAVEICTKLDDIAFGAIFILGKAMMKHSLSVGSIRSDF